MSREDDTSNKLNGNTTWSLTLLSKDYTIGGHPVRIALHNTLCILAGRENTMACKRCEHRQAQYCFAVFMIGLRLRDIPYDSPMWRVRHSQYIEQLFPINDMSLNATWKRYLFFFNKISQNNSTRFSVLVTHGVTEKSGIYYSDWEWIG